MGQGDAVVTRRARRRVNGPAAPKAKTWIDMAIDALPMVGGGLGGVVGGLVPAGVGLVSGRSFCGGFGEVSTGVGVGTGVSVKVGLGLGVAVLVLSANTLSLVGAKEDISRAELSVKIKLEKDSQISRKNQNLQIL